MIKRFLRDERGATMIEYAILTMIITVVIIACLGLIGDNLVAKFLDASAGFN